MNAESYSFLASLAERTNRLVLRFSRDEDGAILAMSMISFLMLFVTVFSVYAVGETVRQRIEIQNAADAGSYSGAVVQADTLSRIAVINRAMAWTYVHLGRMNMDYTVDKWLELAMKRWGLDRVEVITYIAPGCYWKDWYVGEGRYQNKEAIRINDRTWVATSRVKRERLRAAAAGKSYRLLRRGILRFQRIIEEMNRAEDRLLEELPRRIEERVEATVKLNIAATHNDALVNGAGISWCLIQSENPMGYTEVIPTNEERRFLKFTDVVSWAKPKVAFGRGTATGRSGNWWVLDPPGNKGFQRKYRQQQDSRLVASWRSYGRRYLFSEKGCNPSPFATKDERTVRGIDAVGGDSRAETAHAKPRRLLPEFFGRDGAIVVGVARRMNNPLAFLYGGGEEGIFKAFTLDQHGRFMWTASGARAGYRSIVRKDPPGHFDPTFWDGAIEEDENLKNTDWDAVLLPLYRVWSDARAGTYGSSTAGQVLLAVAGGDWKTLTGGGGAIGVQGAPPGMGGGDPAWAALDRWTTH